jgi:uncharacterized protein YggE
MKMKIFSLCVLMTISSCWAAENKTAQLFVKGEAVLLKPADQMQLTIGIVSQDTEAQRALQINNKKMRQLIKNLNDIDLPQTDYQTGQFYISPVYKRQPKEIPAEWQPISHYEVTNTLQIATQKLDLVERIISVAAQAGSNKIDSIQFGLKDPRLYRAEAIEKATQNAIDDATVLAQAARVNLLGVHSISLDYSQGHNYSPKVMYAAAADSSATPIELGNVEVRASVDITFDIVP